MKIIEKNKELIENIGKCVKEIVKNASLPRPTMIYLRKEEYNFMKKDKMFKKYLINNK